MELQTQRLILHPLTPSELSDWAGALPALERRLHVSYQAEPMTGVFQEIVRAQLEATQSDPSNFVWHSFWLLIRAADRVVVGAADFKDVPNAAGESELGYGMGEAFKGQGYMTEAVRSMSDWALTQPGVRAVVAETLRENAASHRVLESSGFIQYLSGETLWWRKTKRRER